VSSLTLQTIPSADEPPATGRRSQVQRVLARRQMGRRALLRLGLGSAMALGMSILQWLPPARLPLAFAQSLSEWPDCNIYYYDGAVCIGGRLGKEYCTAEGWHRDDIVTSHCKTIDYNPLPTRCNGRAAWRWPDGSALWRCADGEMWIDRCGSRKHVYTICTFQLQ
jgi:hypothetical protein